jgi:hypothetical protein
MRMGILALGLAACGPEPRDTTGTDAPSQPEAGADTPVFDTSRVFAHSGGMLYRIDANNFGEVPIGPMTGLGTQSLTDLAIDKDDRMVGITLDKLYSIDPATGTVTLVRDLSQDAHGFTSLSYIPQNLDDPNSPDMLVSANDQGEVFQIDPATGNATQLGSYGTVALGKVRSSGDLFGVRGVGIFATVDVGTEPVDYLATIDPVTWKATPLGSGTGFDKIFGIGFWGGTIYGFVDTGTGGKVVRIDRSSGAGTLLGANTVRWFGAGVATDAPIF